MNKLNRDCFIGNDVQILVNIQILPLVAENSSSTRPAYKSVYARKIVQYKANLLNLLVIF